MHSPEFLRNPQFADPHSVNSEPTLQYSEVAQFALRVPKGSVAALGGIGSTTVQELIDQAGRIGGDRRVLFLLLRSAGSVHDYVEQVIAALAETVNRLWPA